MDNQELIDELKKVEQKQMKQEEALDDLQKKIQITFTVSLSEFRTLRGSCMNTDLMVKMMKFEKTFLGEK